MTIDTTGFGTLTVVAIMAAVTLGTRWGGVFAMSLVPLTRRVRQFIGAMSGSVLVALVAPLAMDGDVSARLALATTAAVVLLLRRPLPAIVAGIVVAAALRQFPGVT